MTHIQGTHIQGWRGRFAVAAAVIIVVAASCLPQRLLAAPARFTLDPDHTTVAFLVSHVGFAKTLGMFKTVSGSFVFDEAAPAVSDIKVTIDAASVYTAHDVRDEHLRNADFLNVRNHPTITFTGTKAVQTGPRTGQVMGDLTMLGVTRPVTFDVTWNKSGAYPFGDKHYAVGFSARTTVKRSDWGMTYGIPGGLVGDEIEIILEVEAKRQEAA
jgi:polyisoprenoid-binding protein YceI